MLLSTKLQNIACDAEVDAVDAGAGDNGTVELRAGDGTTVLATFALPATAFGASGAVNPGEAIAEAITPVAASGTGTAAIYVVKDADGDELWRGTVGTSGSDMVLNTTALVTGGTVQILSWKHTVPSGA